MDTRQAARMPAGQGPYLRMPMGAARVEDQAEDPDHRALEFDSVTYLLEHIDRLEAIGRPVRGIAHDFNNILGIIASFAGFLAEDLPEDTDHHGYATRILTACEHARALVAQSVALARTGRVPRQPADLRSVLRECRDLLGSILPASAPLEFLIGDEPLRVCGNTSEFSEIIVNLCLNAHDALDRKPGSITVCLDRIGPGGKNDHRTDGCAHPLTPGAQIGAGRLDKRRAYARISVADTGTGIDPEILPHIFESFFTTKEAGRGTGLGLAVVYSIVMSYGGACRVDSAPGHGTTFMVYLPLISTR